MKRIVVKVGSNVLTTSEGRIDLTRISALVDQLVWLREQGYEVILVSSGAGACGKTLLETDNHLDSVEQRQLYCAIGQVKLMNLYFTLFREHNLHVGQVLTMKEDFEREEQYNNLKQCMEVMLHNDVIPIVNENDTVCVTELMFTDNDELSGLVAKMMEAETLVILSNIDGLYNGNPANPESKVVRTVSASDDMSAYIQTSKSSVGRGGMQSKYHTATLTAQTGTRVIIANGKTEHILRNIFLCPEQTIFTEFVG
ncbi:MAG: glutamate 5-kinase [Paludibacteraceae bacterium]|nr:glutamate 5-kinase [Paludibacteraceae bacterium]